MLKEHHGFVEVSFADPLKEITHKLFGWPRELLWGPSAPKEVPRPEFASQLRWRQVMNAASEELESITALFDEAPPSTPGNVEIYLRLNGLLEELQLLGGELTPRVVMQRIGAEYGRALWEDVWVHNAVKRAAAPRVVFSDVRFANEANAIHARGGKVVWIDARGRGVKEAAHEHSSESRFEDICQHIDMVMHNNGSLEELEDEVEVLIGQLEGIDE
jgi:hypothetical protein